MKKLFFALIGIAVTASATMVAVKWQSHPAQTAAPVLPSAVTPAPQPSGIDAENARASKPHQQDQVVTEAANNSGVDSPTGVAVPAPPAAKPSSAASFSQPLQILVAPQSSYAQKQAAWKELRDSHQLEKAIADLEHAAAADPSVAEYSATLGQAYVQKIRTLTDYREQAMLAMKADQSFDQALSLDSSNWDARYWKALSLSYWPADLNKSPEVIDNLVTLVEQQESRAPQPHFAQAYVLLGDQYVKAGYADDAKATWQRGASKFPGNDALREKLAGLQ
jgi:hypothetical protein